METSYQRFLAVLLPAAALTLSSLPAQAQNYYTTDFSNVETGSSTTNYTPTAYVNGGNNSPTDPLAGQNAWASNDGTVTSGTRGSSAQLVGNSNYLGPVGMFFGGTFAGALGGVYRVAGGTAGTPDVVPSATNASGGVISLYHPINLTPAAATFALNVDFFVAAPGVSSTTSTFKNHDTFSFTLGNGTITLASINFVPATTADPATNDAVTVTGATGQTATTNYGIVLNSQYHLSLFVTNTATGAFTLQLQGQQDAAPVTVYSGLLGPVNGTTISQAGVLWNLADKTVGTNNGFQGAGDNYIAFDNFLLGVPEPSTYAMMAVGAAGLARALRLRRKQA